MEWILWILLAIIAAVIVFIVGYKVGYHRKEDELEMVGDLIIYSFEDGLAPELYLDLDEDPNTFKTLPQVIFRTRNVKLGKPPRNSQK